MQPFDYYHPSTFDEAFHYLALPSKTVIPMAGGTDFIPMSRDGLLKIDAVIDVKHIPEMREIRETPDGLFIGAAVRMVDIVESNVIKTNFNVLVEAASVVGSDQIRRRATIGGNLCTASPCADTPPALSVLGAQVLLKSSSGERRIPVQEFFTFVRKTVLQKGELVMGVLIPSVPKGTFGVYEKLSRRKGCDLSLVSVAALVQPKGSGYDWRIALGAVAPTVIRATDAETILNKSYYQENIVKASEAAAAQSKPISDVRSSQAYRLAMVRNITKRAVERVLAGM